MQDIQTTPKSVCIPGYSIGRLLGHGATGEVYFAQIVDEFFARNTSGDICDYAIKICDFSQLEESAAIIARRCFAVEAVIQRELAGTGYMLPCLQSGEIGNVGYIVTPYMECGTLTDLVKKMQKMDDPQLWVSAISKLIPSFINICNAIDALHKIGLFHGDIKPCNIFLSNDTALLGDCGSVHSYSRNDQNSSEFNIIPILNSRSPFGSAGYMAPEMFLGDNVDLRADVFGLCSSIYTCISKVRVYNGLNTNDLVKLRYSNQCIPSIGSPLENLNSNFSFKDLTTVQKDFITELSSIVMKGLDFNVTARFDNMKLLIKALSRLSID